MLLLATHVLYAEDAAEGRTKALPFTYQFSFNDTDQEQMNQRLQVNNAVKETNQDDQSRMATRGGGRLKDTLEEMTWQMPLTRLRETSPHKKAQ